MGGSRTRFSTGMALTDFGPERKTKNKYWVKFGVMFPSEQTVVTADPFNFNMALHLAWLWALAVNKLPLFLHGVWPTVASSFSVALNIHEQRSKFKKTNVTAQRHMLASNKRRREQMKKEIQKSLMWNIQFVLFMRATPPSLRVRSWLIGDEFWASAQHKM